MQNAIKTHEQQRSRLSDRESDRDHQYMTYSVTVTEGVKKGPYGWCQRRSDGQDASACT